MGTTNARNREGMVASLAERWWVLCVPVVILVVDQILKAIMVDWIGPSSSVHRYDVVGEFFSFQYLENRGAAFGILPEQTGMLTALSIVIAVFGVILMWREARTRPVAALAIGMIVGGAFGNIVDRIRLGYVVDFVAIGMWPRFNVADSMVTLGVILLLWSAVRDERASSNPSTEMDPDE